MLSTDPAAGHHSGQSSPVIVTMQVAMHALFVLLLAVGAARAAQQSDRPVVVVIGAAGLFAWYVAGLAPARRGIPAAGWVWTAGLLAGWGALVLAWPSFSWVAFALFFLVLHLLPRPVALPVVAVVTVVVIVAQLRGESGSVAARVIGPVMGALVALGVAWVYAQLRAESESRRVLVQELLTAQDDLTALHDELAAVQREAGVLAERSRLARDIHDTLAQGFSSIVLLSRAALVGPPDGPQLRGLMEQVEQTAASGLQDARTVVHALAPAELAEAPLPTALGRLLDRLEQASDIRTQLRVEGEPLVLPTAVDVALLRLAQGALANIRQHARAEHATLTITYRPGQVQLDVVDDGVGFDPGAPLPAVASGFGLRAMRERLADIGGTLTVESAPGDGAALSMAVPLHGGTDQQEAR